MFPLTAQSRPGCSFSLDLVKIPDMEQRTSFKLGKEYVKAVYSHPAYLTYMQSTSSERLGWMKYKLE